MSYRQGYNVGKKAGTFLGNAIVEMLDLGPPKEIDRWATVVEDFNISSLGFYSLLEQLIQEKCIDELIFKRVYKSDGGILSGHRECLQIDWGPLRYLITAAPFGTDYYFSIRLTIRQETFGQFKALALTGIILYGTSWLPTVLPVYQFIDSDWWFPLVMVLSTPFLLWGVRKGYWGNEAKVLEVGIVRFIYGLLFNVNTNYSSERIGVFRAIVEGTIKGNIEGLIEYPEYLDEFLVSQE